MICYFSLFSLAIAKHLNLKTTQKKEDLVRCIFSYWEETKQLDNFFPEISQERPFHKDVNTIPRLLNCLMKHHDKLAVSRLIATRSDLQNRATNGNNPIYIEACKHFNDYSITSGGLVANHPKFLIRHINPDQRNIGELSAPRAYTLIKELALKYSDVAPRLQASGHHNNDIGGYTEDTDVIYAHLWLEKIGNPQLERFFTEGNHIPFSFDTAESISLSSPTESPSQPTPNSNRKRKKEKSIEEYMEEFRN
jgi:hypothetical protein